MIPKLVTTLEIYTSLRETDELATIAWFSREPGTVLYKPVHNFQTHTRQGRRTAHWILTEWQLQCRNVYHSIIHAQCVFWWSDLPSRKSTTTDSPCTLHHECLTKLWREVYTSRRPKSQSERFQVEGKLVKKKYHSVSQSNMSQVSDGMTRVEKKRKYKKTRHDPSPEYLSHVLDGTIDGKTTK